MISNTQMQRMYKEARRVGYQAQWAASTARTMIEFELGEDESVRLRLEPEWESMYAVYGLPEGYVNIYGRRVSAEEEKADQDRLINNLGVWCLISEYRCPCCGEWQHVDSVGMLCGYERPADWRENWYVPDLCQAALERLAVWPKCEECRQLY